MKAETKIICLFFLCIFHLSSQNCKAVKGSNIDSLIKHREIENLTALIRLYGYIKYFHPSSQAIHTDWTTFLIDNIDTIINAKNSKDLSARLFTVFSSIAPSIKIIYNHTDTLKGLFSERIDKNNKSLKVVFWNHVGDGMDKQHLALAEKLIMSNAKSTLIKIDYRLFKSSDSLPSPYTPYIANLSDSIECSFNIALFADKKGTYPHKKNIKKGESALSGFKTRNHQVLAFANIWNIFQHFYPDYNEANLTNTWQQALKDGLSGIVEGESEKMFAETLQKLLSKTNDCHSGIGLINFTGLYTWHSFVSSVEMLLVENKIVVTQINDTTIKNIKVGDIVTEINNKPVDSLLEYVGQYIPASRIEYKYKQASKFLIDYMGKDSVSLTLIDSLKQSHIVKISVSYKGQTKPNELNQELQTIVYKGRTYYYIDLSRFNINIFKKNLKNINASGGLILDGRLRPSFNAMKMIEYLTKDTVSMGILLKPIVCFPDHNHIKYAQLNSWKIFPAKESITVPVAFLSSYSSYSYSETYTEIIDNYHLATIIGENTAGTNGDISFSSISDKYLITWTGNRFLTHKWLPFHGVGVKPTIPVTRTISGIRAKKDEILEEALNYLKGYK